MQDIVNMAVSLIKLNVQNYSRLVASARVLTFDNTNLIVNINFLQAAIFRRNIIRIVKN